MSPKVFISYAWENQNHKMWVKNLATELRQDGIETILDQWETAPGDQLTEFMERCVRESDFILIICTPIYKKKSDKRLGGVGYEGDIITAEVFTGASRRKFIPILKTRPWNAAAPSWLAGSYYLDLSEFPNNRETYLELIDTLQGIREKAPPVSTKDHPPKHSNSKNRDLNLPSINDPSWADIYQNLVNISPPDDELIALGKRALYEMSIENPGWARIYQTIIKLSPPDDELIVLGKRALHEKGL